LTVLTAGFFFAGTERFGVARDLIGALFFFFIAFPLFLEF
jgi:hypothetical protein